MKQDLLQLVMSIINNHGDFLALLMGQNIKSAFIDLYKGSSLAAYLITRSSHNMQTHTVSVQWVQTGVRKVQPLKRFQK